MGRIREYAAMSEMAGDPFRFRLPKKLRKFQPGKALKRLAPSVLPLIPGPIGMAAGFARSYGLMSGDPGPPKRKSAASGPKAKAQKKAAHRAAKASGHHVPGHAKRRGATSKGKGLGGFLQAAGQVAGAIDYGEVARKLAGGIPVVGGAAEDVLAQASAAAAGLGTSGIPEFPTGVAGVTPSGSLAVHTPRGVRTIVHRHLDSWTRKHGRTMNPANTHALRRAARRFEGFKRLIHTVNKALPSGMKFHAGGLQHTAHRKRKR